MKLITQIFKVELTVGIRNNTVNNQTLGEGGFDVREMEINAQKIAFNNAFTLKAKTAILNAPEVDLPCA